MENKQTETEDEALKEVFAKTRKSLIARLDNWEDQKTWDEFYQTYWKLIYSVALKSGLRSEEAFDCVQETILSIAKQSKKNMYDPEQGSFKTWLMNMTRWRINDQFRKRKKDTAMSSQGEEEEGRKTAIIDRVEDPNGDILDRLWETEWKKNIADAALAINVSMAQVYLAKHRVGSVLKKELANLNKDVD